MPCILTSCSASSSLEDFKSGQYWHWKLLSCNKFWVGDWNYKLKVCILLIEKQENLEKKSKSEENNTLIVRFLEIMIIEIEFEKL